MYNTNFTKIYKKLSSIHYELTHNLYIYYRTSNYTEMKIYLNDHHTSEYLQMVLCMYNTDHMYYSPEENSAYIYVGFSLCVSYIIQADLSRTK